MNGKVICNTGPLVALSMIDRIDILRHLFELVAVPEKTKMLLLLLWCRQELSNPQITQINYLAAHLNKCKSNLTV